MKTETWIDKEKQDLMEEIKFWKWVKKKYTKFWPWNDTPFDLEMRTKAKDKILELTNLLYTL